MFPLPLPLSSRQASPPNAGSPPGLPPEPALNALLAELQGPAPLSAPAAALRRSGLLARFPAGPGGWLGACELIRQAALGHAELGPALAGHAVALQVLALAAQRGARWQARLQQARESGALWAAWPPAGAAAGPLQAEGADGGVLLHGLLPQAAGPFLPDQWLLSAVVAGPGGDAQGLLACWAGRATPGPQTVLLPEDCLLHPVGQGATLAAWARLCQHTAEAACTLGQAQAQWAQAGQAALAAPSSPEALQHLAALRALLQTAADQGQAAAERMDAWLAHGADLSAEPQAEGLALARQAQRAARHAAMALQGWGARFNRPSPAASLLAA